MRRALAAAALLVAAATSDGREPMLPDIGPPLILRMEGRFAADRQHAADRADAVSIQVGERERWLAATKVRTVGADHTLSGRAVLNMLAPYEPNLLAVGREDLRLALTTAPEGAPVTVEGLLNRGSRTFLLREVVIGTPPSPAP
jgi:hypothetical protein